MLSGRTEVVNLKKEPHDIYIGRTKDKFHFGNPYTYKEQSLGSILVGSRDECITRFRDWIFGVADQQVEPERREWVLSNIETLRGKRLGCFCKPNSCHGDVYLEYLGETQSQDLLHLFL